jgi:hypothetical protein
MMTTMRTRRPLAALLCVAGLWSAPASLAAETGDPRYPIVGTGQDARHPGRRAAYADNGDGTVTDKVTGLMWAKAPSQPLTFAETEVYARASRLGGHADWRVPTIRELYSLIDYRGGYTGDPATSRPYIDTATFDFAYGGGTGLGDAAHARRAIDVQEWSATRYVGLTMGRDATVFGVNFADGRIKGYPVMDPADRMQTPNRLAVRLVRGRPYGVNDFVAAPETVTDRATGLVWQRGDDGQARSWDAAVAHCEALVLGGADDWRLPDAKELHSIVDYTRIPAIDPLFRLSDRATYLWSSTTHLESPPPPQETDRPFDRRGGLAVYAAIGPALGYMEMPPGSGQRRWLDVHGAGAMRSDPKDIGDRRFPNGFGPQHDDVRGRNLSLCVHDDRAMRPDI